MKTKLEKAFDNYINNYDLNDKKIKIKYKHSYKVENLMKELAIKLGLSKKEIEVSKTIGLLHDIGRFEQIKKTGLWSDVKTGIDHADESCVFLFDNNHIKDFYENEGYYEIINKSIKNHNKYIIDSNLNGKELFFAKMIRDMDKVDIYRVISEEYSYEFDKNELSKKVLESFNSEKTINSKLIKTKSDSVLSFLAFIYDINYNESFIILRDSKNFEKICSVVKPKNGSEQEFNKIINKLNNYIDKKIETI